MIPLCDAQALAEGTSMGLEVEGERLFIVRRHGKVYGYINICPHLELPLEWREHDFLTEDSELIQCANHGALFLIESGECVAGPCFGDFLQAVKIVEEGDKIYLDNTA